jgi:hypothetical protein
MPPAPAASDCRRSWTRLKKKTGSAEMKRLIAENERLKQELG